MTSYSQLCQTYFRFINNDTFTIPEGFVYASILNSAGTGNVTIMGDNGVATTLAPGDVYTFGYRAKGRFSKLVTVDAGTTAEIAYEIF